METVIDWSKAPEGTTHKFSEPTTSPWRDLSGPTWKWWSDEDGWKDSRRSTSDLLKRQSHRITVIEHSVWAGECLPPVGTVCEVQHPDKPDTWCKCTILVWDSECAVFSADANYPFAYDGNGYPENFRQIRTPEQIATDERNSAKKAIQEIIESNFEIGGITASAIAGLVANWGFRKQVQP